MYLYLPDFIRAQFKGKRKASNSNCFSALQQIQHISRTAAVEEVQFIKMDTIMDRYIN